jgi:hypothetical protein
VTAGLRNSPTGSKNLKVLAATLVIASTGAGSLAAEKALRRVGAVRFGAEVVGLTCGSRNLQPTIEPTI